MFETSIEAEALQSEIAMDEARQAVLAQTHAMAQDVREFFGFNMPSNHPDLLTAVQGLRELGVRDRETLFEMLNVLKRRLTKEPTFSEMAAFLKDRGRTLR